MEEMFGPTGTRGLMVCSGRAAFKYFLKGEGKTLGFDTAQFRLLPTRTKLKKGLQQIALWMQNSSGDVITLKNEDKQWIYEVSSGSEIEGKKISATNCDFTAGLLQEFLSWAGGGKFYRVKETTCRAAGDSCCSFVIDKFPLE
jgi:predicted hydrocarbon binding protein